jgi:hypothetical protein
MEGASTLPYRIKQTLLSNSTNLADRTGAMPLSTALWMEGAPNKGGKDGVRVYHTKPKEAIAYKLTGKCAQSTKRREPNRAPRNHA